MVAASLGYAYPAETYENVGQIFPPFAAYYGKTQKNHALL